ncbi:MAG: VWA domain-containing protein [Pirellulaceae bacterium]|nr:VWA domain-containing protein [Pirellulaceae bacterium]
MRANVPLSIVWLLALAAWFSVVVAGCGVQKPGADIGPVSGAADKTAPSLEPELRYQRSQASPATSAAPEAGAAPSRGLATNSPLDQAPVELAAREPSSPPPEAVPPSALPPAVPAAPAPAADEQRDLGGAGPGMGGDRFDYLEENDFLSVADQPLSTFSIDVDTASYSKTRRYLQQNHTLPPRDAVRIEEFINYFAYDYAPPTDEHPFAAHVETAECPWRPGHQLARIGIQGRRVDEQRPPTNLVFLIDVSGSMDYPDKLPLVQRALRMLVERLGENDRVAIVVYAGAAGLVLPSTHGDQRAVIESAIDRLHAGGSTNGGQGIHLAYQVALDHFITGGVNRVLLCTDGDFNVGTTSTGDLVRLAQQQAQAGVYLSVLAFGQGNHNDAMLEQLSNKANGNYAFIDTESEAYKVLVEQMSGTLVTIAKDVKLQVEFNPTRVAAYRLIGYENRKLANRDFNDDRKDAGEIGAGHQVTALYELVPAGEAGTTDTGDVDPLKYQQRRATDDVGASDEWMTVKIRYKRPDEDQSTLRVFPVPAHSRRFGEASPDFQFASAVASFGMLLRRSEHRGDASYLTVFETAAATLGEDQSGYRREFLELVRQAGKLDTQFPADIPASATSAWTPRVTRPTLVRRQPPHLPPTHQPVAAASAWFDTAWLETFITGAQIFWMGAIAGLLVASAIMLGCWRLSRWSRVAASPLPGPGPRKPV